MADVQKENGYTEIANELVEAFAKTYFSSQESKVIWCILRKTYGFHKKEDRISFSQFENITGMKRWNIAKALKRLLERNIICREATGQIIHYSLQKDYEKWDKPLSKQIIVNDSPTIIQMDNTPLSKQITKPLSKQIHTKEKRNYTKEIEIPFELKSITGFTENWNDWINYRKEIKKPLTNTAIKKQFQQLIKFKANGFDILEIINTSITRHWQGLFEPKEFKFNGNGHKESNIYDDF